MEFVMIVSLTFVSALAAFFAWRSVTRMERRNTCAFRFVVAANAIVAGLYGVLALYLFFSPIAAG